MIQFNFETPVAKKPAEVSKHNIWSVTITEFTDEPALSRGDWHDDLVDVRGPFLFLTQKKARLFLRNELRHFCRRTLEQRGSLLNSDEKEWKERLEANKVGVDEMEFIATMLAKGKWVPKKIKWVIDDYEPMDTDVDTSDEESAE